MNGVPTNNRFKVRLARTNNRQILGKRGVAHDLIQVIQSPQLPYVNGNDNDLGIIYQGYG